MAYRVFVTPSAETDLDGYASFLQRRSERRAREWLAGAWKLILSLADSPQRFAVIAESEGLPVEIRDILYHSHRIVFWVNDADATVHVLRVWHAARRPLEEDDLL